VNKRVVYGGGGIMPDVFVAADTSYNTAYFRRLAGKNILNLFALEYYDKNRSSLVEQYKSFEDFRNKFYFNPDDIKTFIAKGEEEGVKYDEEQFNTSKEEILLILKGLIATNIWQTNEYFQIINENDIVIEKALQLISDRNSYDAILGNK
jgi:carboxyl-terminal processing protease